MLIALTWLLRHAWPACIVESHWMGCTSRQTRTRGRQTSTLDEFMKRIRVRITTPKLASSGPKVLLVSNGEQLEGTFVAVAHLRGTGRRLTRPRPLLSRQWLPLPATTF